MIIKAIKVHTDADPSIEMTLTGVAPPEHGDAHAAVEPTMKLGVPGFEAVFAIRRTARSRIPCAETGE